MYNFLLDYINLYTLLVDFEAPETKMLSISFQSSKKEKKISLYLRGISLHPILFLMDLKFTLFLYPSF